jgi:hypothetical protein
MCLPGNWLTIENRFTVYNQGMKTLSDNLLVSAAPERLWKSIWSEQSDQILILSKGVKIEPLRTRGSQTG